MAKKKKAVQYPMTGAKLDAEIRRLERKHGVVWDPKTCSYKQAKRPRSSKSEGL